MLASGVRRSCETESINAVLSASVWRATSSSVRGLAELIPAERDAIWSAASASTRVSTAVRIAVCSVARPDERPEPHRIGLDADPVLGMVGRRRPRPPVSGMGADPVRRLVAWRSHEVRRDARGRRRGTLPGVGEEPLGAGGPGEDPDAVHARRATHPFRDLPGGLSGRCRRRQRSTEGEQGVGFLGSAGGLVGAGVLGRDEPPDGERHEQEQHEIEHLARVGDGE